MDKHILDATCGSKMMWFDKNNEHTIYMDNREVDHKLIWESKNGKGKRFLTIKPDVLADFTKMPFENEMFEHVLFDPPHLKQMGENAWMAQKYGRLPDNWEEVIHDGFWECWRVLKPYGTLNFKWNEQQISHTDIIKIVGKEPMYGFKTGKRHNTVWLVYIKEGEYNDTI